MLLYGSMLTVHTFLQPKSLSSISSANDVTTKQLNVAERAPEIVSYVAPKNILQDFNGATVTVTAYCKFYT